MPSFLPIEEAYAALQSAGLSPQMIQEVLENNGYSLKGISEKTGYTPELGPGPKRNPLDDGWEEDFHLPKLLGDDTGNQLHREENLLDNFAEFLKGIEGIGNEKENFPEIDLPKEVIEFDKQYSTTSKADLLPNVEQAAFTEEKFTGYFLNPDHPSGGDKALVFEKVLGYNKNNWQDLKAEMQKGLLKYRCSRYEVTQHGEQFEVQMMLKGPTGRYAKVKTAWIIDNGETSPRIVSAYIDK